MPAPVVVKFATAGAKEVEAVFASLTKKINDFGRAQASSATRAARAAATASMTGTKSAASAVDREARRLDAIKARSATMAGQHAKRAATAEINEAKRAAREVEKAAKQIERARERATKKAEADARKLANIQARAAKAEETKLGRRAGVASGIVTRGMSNVTGSLTGAAGMLGAGVGVAMVGGGVMSAFQLNKRAALLSNMTQMPGLPGSTARSPEELIKMARAPAMATGMPAEDIMGAMEIVGARAGGAKGIEKLQGDLMELTKLAIGAGISMEDMGGVVAAAFNAGVEPGDDIQGLVRSLIAQGKAGAIEFKDFADELGRLGGVGSKFGSGTRMLQDIGGLTQIAAQTAIGKEGARTVVVDMMREFTQGPKISMLGQMGVSVNDPTTGKMRNPADLMAETVAAIEGGAARSIKLPGISPGQRAKMSDADLKASAYSAIFTGRSNEIATNLAETYRNGYKDPYSPMVIKGADAIRARVEETSRPFDQTKEQSQKEYEQIARMNELARANENFKAKMAELLPPLTKLIPVATALADKFANLVVKFAENPLKGMGALVALSIGNEIMKAGIAETIKAGFTTAMGGKGGLAGALGTIAGITMMVTTVWLTGKSIIDQASDSGEEIGKAGAAAVRSSATTRREASREWETGTYNPETVKKLEAERTAARRALSEGEITAGTVAGAGSLAGLYDLFKRVTVNQQGMDKGEAERVIATNTNLINSMNNLKSSIDRNGGGGKPSNSTTPTNKTVEIP
ncbi:MAG: hypothetical protein M0R22_11175 [Dehalococcoidia bacterium]|jgi:hypothetical protein|nr:hypothetical protein [Dehalococcoidia bacterium]